MASPHVVNIEAEIIQKLVINPPTQPPVIPEPSRNEPKLITDDVPQPIILARMMDQKLIVENDALYDFMKRDDVKGRPLAIVSIAGAFRTGKSFLMNFFLRYLRNRGWENRDWFGEDDTAISPSGPGFFFPFKRSTEGCTKDIRVCPEVFRMPLKDGRTAAVILVDTQGLYDAGLTEDSNARIMSISMLFSSLQLFNILRQMESHHLVSLQLWTSLSAACASIDSNKDKAFQDLKIVIRDYEHGEFAFGKSNNYLAKVLKGLSRIGEMDEVNQSVKSAFGGLGCLLMPHPGKGVTKCEKVMGMENKDMDEDFQMTVKELVEDVFDPENLSVKKKIDGKEADSTDLLHLLGRVGEAYENGKAPTARTALQATIQANNTKALNLAVTVYQEKMSEICSGKFLADDEVNNVNEMAMELAEKGFRDNATMGDEKEKKKFFIQLQRECGDMLKTFYKRNEEEKEKILTHIENMVLDYMKRYRRAIQEKVKNMTLENFQLLHEALKNENMTLFDAEMEKYEQSTPDILKFRGGLERGIDRTFARFEAQVKVQSIEESKIRMIEKFSKQLDELPLHFEEEDEIKVLSTLLNACIVEYTEMTWEKTDDDDSLTDLKTILVNRREEAISFNTTKRAYLIRVCQGLGNFFGNFFEDCLQEELVNGFITEDCFRGYLGEFSSKYLDPLLIGNDKLPEWGKEIVCQKFEEKVAAISKRNMDSKFFRSIRLKVLVLSDKMTPAIRNAIKSLSRGIGKKRSTSEIGNEALDYWAEIDTVEEQTIQDQSESVADEIQANLTHSTCSAKVVGKEGGAVHLFGNELKFHQDAFHEETVISLAVRPSDNHVPEGLRSISSALKCSTSGVQFKGLATIKFATFCSVDKDQIMVLCKKDSLSEWQEIDVQISSEAESVTLQVPHFCWYKIFVKFLWPTPPIIRLHNFLYVNKDTASICCLTTVRDQAVEDACIVALRKHGYNEEALAFPDNIQLEGEEVMSYILECHSPNDSTIYPEEEVVYKRSTFDRSDKELKYFYFKPNPQTDVVRVQYTLKRPDEQRKNSILSLPWNRIEPVVVVDPTFVVERVRVGRSDDNSYNAHLNSDKIYHISPDRRKGKVLIINNYFQGTGSDRQGSEIDVKNMMDLWKGLGFDVIVKSNLNAQQLIASCHDFAEKSVNISVVTVIIMSHGAKRGDGREYISGEDNIDVAVDDIINTFGSTASPHLRGIPKFFIFQACRGGAEDVQQEVADAQVERENFQERADMLITFPTQYGYEAIRHRTEGSWLINEITTIFMERARENHVLDMLTMVNDAVTRRITRDGRIQISNQQNFFTRQLYLFPDF